MTLFHAVVWLDHHQAEILQFDPEHVQASKIKSRTNHTRTHGNGVRTEHEFHAHVCEALLGVPEVLVTGSQTSLKDFQHYVDKHRPALARTSSATRWWTTPARRSSWRWRGASSSRPTAWPACPRRAEAGGLQRSGAGAAVLPRCTISMG